MILIYCIYLFLINDLIINFFLLLQQFQNILKMIYKSSSAYSFSGKSQKTPESNFIPKSAKTNPAPGQYLKEICNTPKNGYHFPKEGRMKVRDPKTPAPGSYEGAQKGLFGQGTPKYSVYTKDKQTIFGSLIENKKKKRNQTPGPGTHDVPNEKLEQTIKKRTITTKFSKLSKDINYDNKVPGVGKYNTIDTSRDFGKSAKGKYTIGSSKRKDIVDYSKTSSSAHNKNDIKALAPGYYDYKPDFGNNAVKITLRGKPKEYKRAKTPGPGDFHHEEAKKRIMKKSPSAGIGLGNKTDIIAGTRKKKVPDPGAYETKTDFDVTNKEKIRTYSFIKDTRFKGPRSHTPGPGEYRVPCAFGNTPSYSGIDNKFSYV